MLRLQSLQLTAWHALEPGRRLLLASVVSIVPLIARAQPAPVAAPPPAPSSSGNPAPGAPAVVPLPPTAAALPTAQPALSSSNPAPSDPATLLLQQATFWRSQNDQGKAEFSLRRLLALQPGNVDALALLIEIDAEQGRTAEAQEYFARLQRSAPADPRIPTLQASLNAGAVEQAPLARARLLASQGKPADSVQAYQEAFHGTTPPPGLAVEYYSVFGNLNIIDFEIARRAMSAIVARDPQDVANQLAYARLLVNRELTRAEGIDRLSFLATLPSIGPSARSMWRQALLWQGPDPVANRELLTYLAHNPSDPQIEAQRQLFKQSLPDESLQVLAAGFDAYKLKQRAEAEKDFNRTLALDPKNVWALTMLAAIRKQQNRLPEAHQLIEQAIALEPQNKARILNTVGGDPNDIHLPAGGGYTRADAQRDAYRAGRAVQLQFLEVARLSNAGQYGAAEARLTRLLHGRTRGNVQLADLQLLDGKTAAAEENFRAALAADPHNPDAAAGLARTLDQQGRPADAAPLYEQARTEYAARGNRAGSDSIDEMQAARLRDEADQARSTSQKLSLYRQAVVAAPSDPWLRLAYARLLAEQGHKADADTVMAPVQQSDTAAALQASIYYAQSNNDLDQAALLINRLPPRARTAQMRQLQGDIALREQVRSIERTGSGPEQVAQLLRLARAPDPDGTRASTIGRALISIGASDQVKPAIDSALAATGGVRSAQRIAYSGVLLAAGNTAEAQTMAGEVSSSDLNTDQQESLRGIRNGIAVVQSDRLNADHKPADAYDQLAPRLQADPRDVSLRLALSRLYQSNGRPAQALAINRSVLRDDPDDLNARVAAIDTAVASHDLGLASRLARQAVAQAPNDPNIYLKAASVEQARGSNLDAVRYLKLARALRQRQLAASVD